MLVVKFWRIENVVLMKVLQQPEDIRRGEGVIYSHDEFELASHVCPRLDGGQMSVMGYDRKLDDKVCVEYFHSKEDAERTLNGYMGLVRRYNASLASDVSDIQEVIVS